MSAYEPSDYELPAPSPRARELHDLMVAFMRGQVLPAEPEYLAHRRAAGADGHDLPPVVEVLKEKARARGCGTCSCPSESGLSQLEYAPIAELSGWSLATRVIDRAIQVHGGAGVTDVTPLAAMYAWHRAMRLFDGPDEVHVRSIAKAELRRDPIRSRT